MSAAVLTSSSLATHSSHWGNPTPTAARKTHLLGENPDQAMLAKLSSQKQVTSETPPTFLWHTGEDTSVLPENSVAFYLALRKANVPAELHIYERGRHGLGLAHSVPATADWTARCVNWLRHHGVAHASSNAAIRWHNAVCSLRSLLTTCRVPAIAR